MKRLKPFTILILTVTILGVAFGCTSQNATIKNEAPAVTPQPQLSKLSSQQTPVDYAIQPGDELDIKFFYNPELNEKVIVRPDGMISLQLVDEVEAAWKTPAELDKFLTEQYARELRKPMVTVLVRSFKGQRIFVGGEVNNQGLIELPPGMTAIQAVFQAGGLKETAQPGEALIIRKGSQNEPIPIRVNLASVDADSAGADFELQPDDIVYVPKSAIAKANKFVKQYISDLFLYRGVSLGFGYEVNNFRP